MANADLENVTLSDLEFENGELVVARGARLSNMSADDLVALANRICALLHRELAKSTSEAQKLIPGLLNVDGILRDLSSGLQRRGDWDVASRVNYALRRLVETMDTIHVVEARQDEDNEPKGPCGQPHAIGTGTAAGNVWTLDDVATADEILALMGTTGNAAGSESLRDAIAAVVGQRAEAAVRQEREGCAFAVECHSGFGDPESIEACAALVRARGEDSEECVHLLKTRFADIMGALYYMSDALERIGKSDPARVSEFRSAMAHAQRLAEGTVVPTESRPLASEVPLDPKAPTVPKFKVGDEVVRVSGGEWLGMKVGDTGVVAEVRATAANWHQLRIEGYHGLYSDFRYKLAAELEGAAA